MPSKPLPYSVSANSALRLANQEALRLGHSHLQTGHVLLGLAKSLEGVIPSRASQLLASQGFDVTQATTMLENRVGIGENTSGANVPHDHKVQHVLRHAEKIAKKDGRSFIDTLDILESLAMDRSCDAAAILSRTIDFDPTSIRAPFQFEGTEKVSPQLGKVSTAPAR